MGVPIIRIEASDSDRKFREKVNQNFAALMGGRSEAQLAQLIIEQIPPLTSVPVSALPPLDNYFEFTDPEGYPAAPTGGAGEALQDVAILHWDFGPLEALRTYEVYQNTSTEDGTFVPDVENFTNRTATTAGTVISIPRPQTYFTAPYDVYYKVCAVNTRGDRSAFVTFGPYRFVEVQSQADIADLITAIKTETGWVGAAQLAADVAQSQYILSTTRAQADAALAAAQIDLSGPNVIGSLAATRISAGQLAAGVIYSNRVNASQLVADGALLGDAFIGNLSASHIQTGTIGAQVIWGGTIGCDKLVVGAGGAVISQALIGDLSANKIKTGTLAANIAVLGKVYAENIDVTNAKITSAMIDTIDAAQINVGTLSGFTINGGIFTTKTAHSGLQRWVEIGEGLDGFSNYKATLSGTYDETLLAQVGLEFGNYGPRLVMSAFDSWTESPGVGKSSFAAVWCDSHDARAEFMPTVEQSMVSLVCATVFCRGDFLIDPYKAMFIPGTNHVLGDVKMWFDTGTGRLKVYKASTNQTYTFKPGEWAS